MDFFEVVARRRSIRRFSQDKVPEEVIRRALEAAILAPNSSNAQTWDFYWVRNPEKKAELVRACMSQSAARTATELVVVVASPSSWRRSWPKLREWVQQVQAPEKVQLYYNRLFPIQYQSGFGGILGVLKKLIANLIGLFRPMIRSPFSFGDIQEVCIKSAALASENFVLAVTAQGFSTCMMEGFDEFRVRRLLGLKRTDRVVMVIAVGKESLNGTWGSQYRLPFESVVHEV